MRKPSISGFRGGGDPAASAFLCVNCRDFAERGFFFFFKGMDNGVIESIIRGQSGPVRLHKILGLYI